MSERRPSAAALYEDIDGHLRAWRAAPEWQVFHAQDGSVIAETFSGRGEEFRMGDRGANETYRAVRLRWVDARETRP